ncbi:MAG: hypothetical protein ABS76_19430 [Pelagibacterium sp. SCN 64-44]|nr:MAG: hypothetical protein ABS76_19430 [Pelagibacterium sp. SCN 64-44]
MLLRFGAAGLHDHIDVGISMTIQKISALAIAGLMSLGVIATVAQDAFVAPATPEEAVAARKAIMRENGMQLRTAGRLAGDEAVATMQTLFDNYSHLPLLFPEGSIVGDSEALPAVWERWDEFVAIADATRDSAQAGLEAAKAGDTAGYTAALQAIGGSCNQCHQVFRR